MCARRRRSLRCWPRRAARGADSGDFLRPLRPCLLGHADDRGDRPLHRLLLETARVVEPLAKPRDLGAIDQLSPPAVRRPLGEVELDRVRAHVDDRVPSGSESDERHEAAREAHVRLRVQVQRAQRRSHEGRILGLDRDGARGERVRPHCRELRSASAERVVSASLVHGDGEEVGALAHDLVDELVELVRVALERWRGHAEPGEQRSDVRRGNRELRLRNGPPLLQPVVADLLEALHVQHASSNLDAALAATRQDVQLVALVHAGRLERGQPLFRLAERLAEGPPLPARDDHPGVGCEGAAGVRAPSRASRRRRARPPGASSRRLPRTSRDRCGACRRRRIRARPRSPPFRAGRSPPRLPVSDRSR